MISVEDGERGCGFCDVLQRLDELKLASNESCSEGAVSGRYSGYYGLVAGGGGG